MENLYFCKEDLEQDHELARGKEEETMNFLKDIERALYEAWSKGKKKLPEVEVDKEDKAKKERERRRRLRTG
ncbi:hypothetical protein DY000_02036172 [Brassica cretica]|uniref:Uncharacterized protein n=1 Tax=Brassica cretica TaxID=69181 RepID=A0ABQ7B7I4_BRACR|nr:hypothetical protein DY000_02036172 [Brassica cretica]